MKIVSDGNMDRGLAYAEACFETFRVIDGETFAWEAHCRRLAAGLAEFGIGLSGDEFERLRIAAVDAAREIGTDALVRLTITGGSAAWGLVRGDAEPVAHIQAVAMTKGRGPAMLQLKSWPFPLKPKRAKFTSDYAETLRALQGTNGPDVLFEQHGMLIAAATANLLIHREGRWWTPVAGAGVLPGVVRAHLLARGVVKESECPLAWLQDCAALALTNSGSFIRPVAAIEGDRGFDAGHPAFDQLREVLHSESGVPKDLA